MISMRCLAVLGFALTCAASPAAFAANATVGQAKSPKDVEQSHIDQVNAESNRGLCVSEGENLGQVLAINMKAPRYDHAKSLHEQGMERCNAGDYTTAMSDFDKARSLLR